MTSYVGIPETNHLWVPFVHFTPQAKLSMLMSLLTIKLILSADAQARSYVLSLTRIQRNS